MDGNNEKTEKPFRFLLTKGERPICPQCGGNKTYRNGVRAGHQYYRCNDCHKSWRGEIPPPAPDRPCPYCKGQCRPAGKRPEPIGEFERRDYEHLMLFQNPETAKTAGEAPERGTLYYFRCTVCQRYNTELWPNFRPYKYAERCFYRLVLCLDWRAVKGLDYYCQKHRVPEPVAIRRIFAEAGPLRIGVNGRVHSFPPKDDGKSPLPPLPSFGPESWRKLTWEERMKRPRPGVLTVCVWMRKEVLLDRPAYVGFLAFLRRTGMTRQDAARALLAARIPRCVGMVVSASPPDD